MDLAKLVIEGFDTKSIRKSLDRARIVYGKDDRTIALLEKLISGLGMDDKKGRLAGLRTVQSVRSKAKGHVGGREAWRLSQKAQKEHGTYSDHFQHVCAQVADELKLIEQVMFASR